MTDQYSRQPTLLAWSLFILLAVIWGSSFILMKKGLTAFQPGEVAGIRIFTASVFLLPIAVNGFRKVRRRHTWFLFVSGFFGSLLPAFLFPIAQTRISSSVTGVLNSLTPLFTILLGALFFHSRFNFRIISGTIIGFLGSAVLIFNDNNGGFPDINFFALFVVLATLFYGLNVNIIKYYLADVRPLHIACISMVMIGPFALAYLLIKGDVLCTLQHDHASIWPFIFVMILGIIGTALAMVIFNNVIRITNTVFASSVTYLIPVIAVIWGILDGETLLPFDYLGMGAIITGVLIANRGRNY